MLDILRCSAVRPHIHLTASDKDGEASEGLPESMTSALAGMQQGLKQLSSSRQLPPLAALEAVQILQTLQPAPLQRPPALLPLHALQ